LTAWELGQAWPDAELKVIEDAGHTGSPAMGTAIRGALARFADESAASRRANERTF
jgi:proline iminopeptidase